MDIGAGKYFLHLDKVKYYERSHHNKRSNLVAPQPSLCPFCLPPLLYLFALLRITPPQPSLSLSHPLMARWKERRRGGGGVRGGGTTQIGEGH